MMRLQTVAFALLTSLVSPGIAQADAVDDLIRQKMVENPTPGVALAIVGPDGRADVRTYGIANFESGEPVVPQTVFRIASLSKQFCAYTALKLQEEGRLSLNDPVTKTFPELPAPFQTVTIKDLIGHRSGIADPEADFSYRTEYSDEAYIRLLAQRPLAEAPGSTYRYNNHAYSLLGLLVGKVDGSSLPALVKRLVFDPVGMQDTRYYTDTEIVPRRAQGYQGSPGNWQRRLVVRPRIFHGSGGILSTVQDLVKYEQELRNPAALSPTVLQQQRTPLFGEESGYGGGWQISKSPEGHHQHHSGSSFGFTSYFFRDLGQKTTYIILRNSQSGNLREWVDALRELNAPNP